MVVYLLLTPANTTGHLLPGGGSVWGRICFPLPSHPPGSVRTTLAAYARAVKEGVGGEVGDGGAESEGQQQRRQQRRRPWTRAGAPRGARAWLAGAGGWAGGEARRGVRLLDVAAPDAARLGTAVLYAALQCSRKWPCFHVTPDYKTQTRGGLVRGNSPLMMVVNPATVGSVNSIAHRRTPFVYP